MFADAVRELDLLPEDLRTKEPCLGLKVAALMAGRRWEEACSVCARLREASPEGTTGYIHGAFCLHELGQTSEARTLLLGGPKSLLQEPTFHYNLGCYAAVLGDLEEARRHLETSFLMDKKFREIARRDPDLRCLRDEI
jgi:Flp pilus assembly protein TadD